MKLFANEVDPAQNLLPYDGVVNYYGLIVHTCRPIDFYYHHTPSPYSGATMRQSFWKAHYDGSQSSMVWRPSFFLHILPYHQEAHLDETNFFALKQLIEQQTGGDLEFLPAQPLPQRLGGMGWHSDGRKPEKMVSHRFRHFWG
ncbi:MAG: hypothetical protein R2795_11805 [Saprospiraceae bacterium]